MTLFMLCYVVESHIKCVIQKFCENKGKRPFSEAVATKKNVASIWRWKQKQQQIYINMQTEKGKEKVQANPFTEDDLSVPLSGMHLKKNIRRIKRGKGDKKQLDALLEAITAQAKHVREMKASSVEGDGEKWRKQAVMSEIFKLMELKYQYCSLSPVPITTPELFVATEVTNNSLTPRLRDCQL